jgi:hypothetical protein
MAKLIITDDSGSEKVVLLRPGRQVVGRSETSDICIPHGSVSSTHCELLLDSDQVTLRDLGSTNGTFHHASRVQELNIRPGDRVRLGSVDVLYAAEDLPGKAIAPPAIGSSAGIRLQKSEAPSEPTPASEEVIQSESLEQIPGACLYHADRASEIICPACSREFCKPCVKSQRVGIKTVLSCPACGAFCQNKAAFEEEQRKARTTFYAEIPAAFKFPFSGHGPLLLVSGTLFFAALEFGQRVMQFFGRGWMYWFLVILGVGYLYSFMQSIVTSAAHGDDRMPGWPDFSGFWDSMISPFLQVVVGTLICFGPALAAFALLQNAPVAIGLLLLGGFYYPMALLALAMTDTLTSLNPMVLIPSIMRVLAPYTVTALLLLGIVGAKALTGFLLDRVSFPGVSLLLGTFVGLYAVIVEMRLLGILYRKHHHKLGWF